MGGRGGGVIYFGCVTNGVGSDCFYYEERQCSVLLRTMEREREKNKGSYKYAFCVKVSTYSPFYSAYLQLNRLNQPPRESVERSSSQTAAIYLACQTMGTLACQTMESLACYSL